MWETVVVRIFKITFLGAKPSSVVECLPGLSFTLGLINSIEKKILPIPSYVLKAQLKGVSLHCIAYSLDLNQE